MIDNSLLEQLRLKIPGVAQNEPLSRHSTIRAGGLAAAFLVTKTIDELVSAVTVVRELGILFRIIGGGSNTLFSDKGFDGLVIKNLANGIDIAGAREELDPIPWQPVAEIRHEAANPSKYVSFLDLNYDERPGDTLVTVESGINLTALIIRSLDAGLLGLEWFGGIPGTLGGAIYNNIHGGTHFIGERVNSVEALTGDGSRQSYAHEELAFSYDKSRFHDTAEVILRVELSLTKGTKLEIDRADDTFRQWVRRKGEMQPKLGSLGSTFQNISQADRQKIGAPTTSAGWIIEQVGLKGHRIGDAQIAPEHANFIINHGGATSSDIYALIRLAQKEVKKKFGLDLQLEVFLVGEFDY